MSWLSRIDTRNWHKSRLLLELQRLPWRVYDLKRTYIIPYYIASYLLTENGTQLATKLYSRSPFRSVLKRWIAPWTQVILSPNLFCPRWDCCKQKNELADCVFVSDIICPYLGGLQFEVKLRHSFITFLFLTPAQLLELTAPWPARSNSIQRPRNPTCVSHLRRSLPALTVPLKIVASTLQYYSAELFSHPEVQSHLANSLHGQLSLWHTQHPSQHSLFAEPA